MVEIVEVFEGALAHDKYNGDRKSNANWSTYVQRLKQNVGTYQAAEKAGGPNSHFAD